MTNSFTFSLFWATFSLLHLFSYSSNCVKSQIILNVKRKALQPTNGMDLDAFTQSLLDASAEAKYSDKHGHKSKQDIAREKYLKFQNPVAQGFKRSVHIELPKMPYDSGIEHEIDVSNLDENNNRYIDLDRFMDSMYVVKRNVGGSNSKLQAQTEYLKDRYGWDTPEFGWTPDSYYQRTTTGPAVGPIPNRPTRSYPFIIKNVNDRDLVRRASYPFIVKNVPDRFYVKRSDGNGDDDSQPTVANFRQVYQLPKRSFLGIDLDGLDDKPFASLKLGDLIGF